MIILTHYSSNGQNIAERKLVWRAVQVVEGQSSAKPMKCEFTTNRTQSVSWSQKQGELTTNFKVISTEGNWTNVMSSGSFTYTLENSGRICTMRFERSASGVTVLMDFLKDGLSASKLQFQIETIE